MYQDVGYGAARRCGLLYVPGQGQAITHPDRHGDHVCISKVI